MVVGLLVGVPPVGVFGILVVHCLFVVVVRCVCGVSVHWLVWVWVVNVVCCGGCCL